MQTSQAIYRISFFIVALLGLCVKDTAAQSTMFIYTSEGKPILRQKELVNSCLQSLHANKSDINAVAICECQVNNLDRKFSSRQYKKYNHGGMIDIQSLINEDSVVQKKVQACFTKSGKTMLLQAQGFKSEFIDSCVQNIKRNTKKNLDDANINNFCSCQLNLIKERKLSDAQLDDLENPNSLLFYEVMYKCGDPFKEKGEIEKNWTKDLKNDIAGPDVDTINIITINGLSYLKIKTGSLVQFWLFDTGASDLLINKEMEKTLQDEGVLTQQNYIGIGEYEMANGVIDTCRKYLAQNLMVGKYKVNNIVLAVTDKGKRIIAGKSLLNKFNNWKLDNEKNFLILNK